MTTHSGVCWEPQDQCQSSVLQDGWEMVFEQWLRCWPQSWVISYVIALILQEFNVGVITGD